MEPAAPKLETSIRNILRPRLNMDSFTGSGKNFRREFGGWIHAICIQPSRSGGEFCFNLGIHPQGVPTQFQSDPKKIREIDCEFRCRLTETSADQWWPYENTQDSMDAAIALATDVYLRLGRPMLAQYAEPHCPLSALTITDIANDSLSKFGFQTTDLRAALTLARMHRAQNRPDQARQFAEWGLTNLGRATALKSDFEELLIAQ